MRMNVPTSRDYAKVASALSGDPWFEKKLGSRQIKVYKSSGASVDYPEGIVAVTAFMVENNFEPASCNQGEIQAEAAKLFDGSTKEAKRFYPSSDEVRPGKKADAPEADAPSAGRTRARKARVEKTPKEKAPKPAKVPRAPKLAATRSRRGRRAEAPEAETPTNGAPVRRSKAVEAIVPVWAGMISNCVVIQQMLETHDFTPKRDARLKLITELTESIANETQASGSTQGSEEARQA
jgi:hypothetical protein